MEVYSAPGTLVTPAATLTFNDDTGNTLQHDAQKCSGLGMAAVRAAVDDKPQTDGGIVHDGFLAALRPTLGGIVRIRTGDYFAQRNALMKTIEDALTSIVRADGTYSWLVDGSTYTITIRCEIGVSFTGYAEKAYLFALVAGSPTIAIT